MSLLRCVSASASLMLLFVAVTRADDKEMAVAPVQVGSITGHVEKIDKSSISVKVDQSVAVNGPAHRKTINHHSVMIPTHQTKTTRQTMTYTLADNVEVRNANSNLKVVAMDKVAVGDLVTIHVHKARLDKADLKAPVELVIEFIDVSHNANNTKTLSSAPDEAAK